MLMIEKKNFVPLDPLETVFVIPPKLFILPTYLELYNMVLNYQMMENKDQISGMRSIFLSLPKKAVISTLLNVKKPKKSQKKGRKIEKKKDVDSHSFIIDSVYASIISDNRKKIRIFVYKKDRKSGKMKKKTRTLCTKSALLPKRKNIFILHKILTKEETFISK